MTTIRLQTREQRRKLKPREAPYWVSVARGRSVGYRAGATGGWWLSRVWKDGGYDWNPLGAADDTRVADGKTVLTWNQTVAKVLDPERPTSKAAGPTIAEAWVTYGETRDSPIDPRERATWARFIEPALGDQLIAELTTEQLEKWRAEQVTKHGQRRTNGETDPRERRRRAQYTATRRLNLLKAVLNDAFSKNPDAVKSDAAWRRVKAYRNVDRPRKRTVTAEEARRLLNALSPELRALARAALYTGLRLGELQGLVAADVANGEVHVRHSKSGRERSVPLSRDGVTFFGQVTTGKAGDARLFAPVSRVALSRAMKEASATAKIAPAVTFHDLRRSYGSLLINAGTPVEVIQKLLGHSDTRMTLRAYAHVMQKTLRAAVDANLPSFGIEPSNVAPMTRRAKRLTQ
jgi:integrase